MKAVLAIFRKDARHFWPQIVVFVSLVLLSALLDPTYTHHPVSTAESLMEFALPLACLYLVTSVIHEDRLPGDRQYWLTRPFSGTPLLTAKALFIAVFVNLPVFLCQAGVLAWVGIPPAQHLTTLLWRQAFFSAILVLPAAALASVTRNLKQVILALMMIAAPLLLLMLAPGAIRQGMALAQLLSRVLTAGFWLKNVFFAACLAAGSAAILVLQYRRRITRRARALFACSLVLAIAVAGFATPERAFAIRTFLTAGRILPSAVRISQAPGEIAATLISNGRQGNRVRLSVPIRVDAIPPGMEWLSVGLNGWLGSTPVTGELAGSPASPVLVVSVALDAYDRLKSAPAVLKGSVDLALFARGDSAPAPQQQPEAIPGVGACSTQPDPDGKLTITCYSPFPRASLAVVFPGGGRHWIVGRRTLDEPIPTSAGFAALDRYTSPTPFDSWSEVHGLRLVTERPAGAIHREFDLKDLHLPRLFSGKNSGK